MGCLYELELSEIRKALIIGFYKIAVILGFSRQNIIIKALLPVDVVNAVLNLFKLHN